MSAATTLNQWVRYAAEILHPKTNACTHPWIIDWPQLKPLCNALVEAAKAGESTAIQWEIADEINQLLIAIRARQAERVSNKPTTGSAKDVLTKPGEIREQEEALKALKKKVQQARPMPALFDLPAKPAPKAKAKPPVERHFFEKGA